MKGVLLDANLLCLLAVGATGASAIDRHPRLRAFGLDDYVTVTRLLDRLEDVILCPHVLAETSNLISYRQSDIQVAALRRSLARVIGMSSERSIAAQLAVGDPVYERLGITDAVLLLLAANPDLLLLSDDLGLCLEAGRRRLRVVNYNNIRDGALRPDQIE